MLIQLQSDFEASARRVDEEITQQEAEMHRALEARFTALRMEAKSHLASGLKHFAIRVDDLTMNRSRAAMVSEEAARVLRMSEYALLAHTASVEQHMARTRQAWEAYQLDSKLPEMMQLRSSPELLLNEIAVAGLVDQAWSQVQRGQVVVPAVQPALRLSAHRTAEQSQHQREMQEMRQSAEAAAKTAAAASKAAATKAQAASKAAVTKADAAAKMAVAQAEAAALAAAKDASVREQSLEHAREQLVLDLKAAFKDVRCVYCRAKYKTSKACPEDEEHRWDIAPVARMVESIKDEN